MTGVPAIQQAARGRADATGRARPISAFPSIVEMVRGAGGGPVSERRSGGLSGTAAATETGATEGCAASGRGRLHRVGRRQAVLLRYSPVHGRSYGLALRAGLAATPCNRSRAKGSRISTTEMRSEGRRIAHGGREAPEVRGERETGGEGGRAMTTHPH